MFDPKLIILIAVIAILGFGVFWGFLRKLRRTLLRLVTLLLSFGAAIVLVKLIGRSLGKYVISLLQPLLGESVGELLAQPEMGMVIDALCEMVSAPILFLLSYIVLKLVSWIIYKIFAMILGVKGPKFGGRLLGAFAGVLCGMVGLVVFVTPVFGYMTLANDVWHQIAAQTQEEETQEPNVLEQMLEAPLAKEAYQLVGKHVFSLLTTVDFEEDTICLADETGAIVNIWKDFSVLSGSSAEQYGTQESQAMKQMVEDVGSSKIVSCVVAYFLSDASEAWLNGEQVLGMAKPNLGEDVQGIADAFLAVFATTNTETLVQDLGTFADAFGVLVEEEVFTMGNDNADFVNKLVSGGVVEKLYTVLDANPRMEPVKTAIRDTGVRVMMSYLGVPEDIRETHGEMLEDMAGTLQSATQPDGTIDQAALSTGICEVMNNYDIAVSPEASQLIAEAIVENLTPEEILSMTPEQIADKMAERFLSGEGIQVPAA